MHRLLVACSFAMVLMVLADATNPYLAAPGHGWVMFLGLGVCVAALSEGPCSPENVDAPRASRTITRDL
jgi:hypothetical protein